MPHGVSASARDVSPVPAHLIRRRLQIRPAENGFSARNGRRRIFPRETERLSDLSPAGDFRRRRLVKTNVQTNNNDDEKYSFSRGVRINIRD